MAVCTNQQLYDYLKEFGIIDQKKLDIALKPCQVKHTFLGDDLANPDMIISTWQQIE